MPDAAAPSKLDPQTEVILTVHVSRRGAFICGAVLAVIIGLVLYSRSHPPARKTEPSQNVPSSVSGKATLTPIGLPSQSSTKAKDPGPTANRTERNQVTYISEASPDSATTVEASESHTVLSAEPEVLASAAVTNTNLTVIKASGEVTFNGAGATFPYPIYTKWFNEYHKRYPEIQFNYQAIGSGGGIRRILADSVDFGASDVPMSDDQLSQSKTGILHIPTVLGAVVPICNVPGASEIRLTPETLAGIYLGKIASWNDARIAKDNPQANLPNQPIIPIHRSEGSATTFIFTDYLSKVSGEWQISVGKATSVAWPVGIGGKGNEGVAALVHQTEGAIGFVDLLYAQQEHLSYTSVRNSAGKFVKAALDNVTESAASVGVMPSDFRISITNAPGSNAYPISSYTWMLVPRASNDDARARNLDAFLAWMATDGQAMAKELGYAPLPRNVAAQVRHRVARTR